MGADTLSAAASGLTQALQQLPPHTHVLMAVADRAASFFDLSSPRPQSWVLAGSRPPPGPDATRRLLRASGVRPAPLGESSGAVATALRALAPPASGGAAAAKAPAAGAAATPADRPAGREAEDREEGEAAAAATEWQRLAAAAAAIDLSLHLLGHGMAAWDARHKAELTAAQALAEGSAPASPSRQPFPAKPMHAARVLFVTAGGACRQPLLLDARSEAELRRLYEALGSKAAALDAQIDAVVGDAGAPALPYLLDASEACGGAVLHQPGLAAPFAANVAALCLRRIGWDAFIDVRTPAGIKLKRMVGPMLVQGPAGLPESISPVDAQPVVPAQGGDSEDGGGGGGGAAGAEGAGVAGLAAEQPQQQQQPQPRSRPGSPAKSRVSRPAVPPTRLSAAAAAAPSIDRGRFYGAALELTSDLAPGVAQEIQVLWEWTAADGRRVRQVRALQGRGRGCGAAVPWGGVLGELRCSLAVLHGKRAVGASTNAAWE
jgi:hypothetical protein